MNRLRITTNPEKLNSVQLQLVKESLQVIQSAHLSNDQIVNKLVKASKNEEQQQLCTALQKDMKLINEQLEKIFKKLSE